MSNCISDDNNERQVVGVYMACMYIYVRLLRLNCKLDDCKERDCQ